VIGESSVDSFPHDPFPNSLFYITRISYQKLTKIYSQGAQVTHKTIDKLPSNVKSHIKAIVVFGDPFKGKAFNGVNPGIVHTECYPNDNVCNGLPLPVGAHNEYDKQVPAVADWIVKTLGPL
jgi:Cutinase